MAINWYGDALFDKSKDELAKRLERAAIFLENAIKQNLSEKCQSEKTGGGRSASGQFVKKTEIKHHSPAGGFPFLETGELRRSITHYTDKDALIARVGSNLVYARFLEGSTSKMPARPFLQPTLEANQGAITEILRG